jgi:hypothetical protein
MVILDIWEWIRVSHWTTQYGMGQGKLANAQLLKSMPLKFLLLWVLFCGFDKMAVQATKYTVPARFIYLISPS